MEDREEQPSHADYQADVTLSTTSVMKSIAGFPPTLALGRA